MKTTTTRTPAPPPLRTTDHTMALGPQATRALATLCRRYQVQPECVLRSIVESFLADACGDDTLAPCLADAARLLAAKAGGRAKTKAERVIVELDDLASAMLRRTCREGNACREAGEDPRDLVNAAVTYYLCDDTDHRHGEYDLDDGSDVLTRAKSDRLACEEKEAA